jgi:hypothetical protein
MSAKVASARKPDWGPESFKALDAAMTAETADVAGILAQRLGVERI